MVLFQQYRGVPLFRGLQILQICVDFGDFHLDFHKVCFTENQQKFYHDTNQPQTEGKTPMYRFMEKVSSNFVFQSIHKICSPQRTITVDLEIFGGKNASRSSSFNKIKTREIFYYDNYFLIISTWMHLPFIAHTHACHCM